MKQKAIKRRNLGFRQLLRRNRGISQSTNKSSNVKTKEISELKIVKRKGHVEIYNERKVYGSCYFACRNAHLTEEEAESISNIVTSSVTKWISRRKIVTSSEIFRILTNELAKYNEDAAFLYETHRDIS